MFSIHASAKEATRKNMAEVILICVFNPRLREGGDPNCEALNGWCACFQSTPPRRRRHVSVNLSSLSRIFQSTPPRRRRRYNKFDILIKRFIFNPRLREGGDGNHLNYLQLFHLFQSTPPRRRRLLITA